MKYIKNQNRLYGGFMRLWHKDLLNVLPNKMLLSQWRELSAIVGSINKNGTPNHRLVNILLEYDKSHLFTYSNLVYDEMKKRNMSPQINVYNKINDYCNSKLISKDILFNNWHNDRYYRQCYYNLEEKYDRGIISKEEWMVIYNDKYS